MIPIPIECLFIVIALYLTYCLHESGHYMIAKLAGKKNVEIGYKLIHVIPTPAFVKIEEESSDIEIFFVIIGGILLGLVPYICLYYLSDDLYEGLIALCFVDYFVFCCSLDFRDIFRLAVGGTND